MFDVHGSDDRFRLFSHPLLRNGNCTLQNGIEQLDRWSFRCFPLWAGGEHIVRRLLAVLQGNFILPSQFRVLFV